ncbi:unnamed protein product [Clonostachys rhizophaga]|uniref:amidase n=1 Tax=Clonostachys rhizophaga TaxID=160324 RepID=A0A9N9VFY5_9HYPO|nr:unnamed protein product [Clonostachys rhizophaga]
MTWETIAAQKRDLLKASIPAEWVIPQSIMPPESQEDVTDFPKTSGWFTERELEITSTPASLLLKNMATGSWTSESVTRAFCKAAATAHQLTNCLSDMFFDKAIARARELDAYWNTTGRAKGPLHGLPISLKDSINFIGHDSTIGFASLVNSPATYNSTLVDILLNAGAVLYVKTNVPTALMFAESVNNVFGRTVNPRNRRMTPGGSSGGESALIALGGSRLGVGTDIGGSLRIPAACTGIFALRPSFGRFPTAKSRPGLAGQEAVCAVNGPMALTLEEVALWAKIIVDQQPWLHDPKCLPIPWRSLSLNPTVKIAVLWHDGHVTPTPPVARALEQAVAKLKQAGHALVDWDPKWHRSLLSLHSRMLAADGGRSVTNLLAPTGEPLRKELEEIYAQGVELGAYDMWQLQLKRNIISGEYLSQWNDSNIDAILCPTTPYSTVENGKFAYLGYTSVWNVLDYPAVSFPCGVNADKAIDTVYAAKEPLSQIDAQVHNADGVHGMPVSLQLVGRRLEDEKTLMMTEVVLKALRHMPKFVKNPGTARLLVDTTVHRVR